MIADIFGPESHHYLQTAEVLIKGIRGKAIDWPVNSFSSLLEVNPAEAMKQYWQELLGRAFIASACSINRQHAWLTGTIEAYISPNYLVFAAALRGLIEASADSMYSLRCVPSTIADNSVLIRKALAGTLNGFGVCEEMEDKLIHFLYAGKHKNVPENPKTHSALHTCKYLEALQDFDQELLFLYSQLCEINHPAFESISWMYNVEQSIPYTFKYLGRSDENHAILRLIEGKQKNLLNLLMAGFNPAMLCLKVLRHFDLPDIDVAVMDQINLSKIPAWNKLESQLVESRR